MATDNSPPKIRIILTVAFSSVIILVALNYVFKSYFLMMTEDVEHDHLATPVELQKLHEGEQRNLTTSNLPIAKAMQELSQRGREGSDSLKAYADITPQQSDDMGPMVGWIRAPNQAVIDAMNAAPDPDAGATPAAAGTSDGGTAAAMGATPASATDAGAGRAAAGDAGTKGSASKVTAKGPAPRGAR